MSFHLLEGVNLMIKLVCKQGEASTRPRGGNVVCGNRIFFYAVSSDSLIED